MKLLAIDTATEACSAAILMDEEILFRYRIAPQQHAELILPMVDELLTDAGITLTALDALAFGRGPGAFTGVRIAAGVVQGLAYGADLPVIPVSDLAALAQGVAAEYSNIISAIDARMGEIYWCHYHTDIEGLVMPGGEERISRPDQLIFTAGESYYGVGTGWQTYAQILQQQLHSCLAGCDGERYPHAKDILILAKREFENGRAVGAEHAQPVYLRNEVTGRAERS